jgi:hypothetical protein
MNPAKRVKLRGVPNLEQFDFLEGEWNSTCRCSVVCCYVGRRPGARAIKFWHWAICFVSACFVSAAALGMVGKFDPLRWMLSRDHDPWPVHSFIGLHKLPILEGTYVKQRIQTFQRVTNAADSA